jgi:hypothetical protein
MMNSYCETLGIEVPVLERVVRSRSPLDGAPPSLFHLLVVALLERGAPMTLEGVAEMLEAAGAGPIGSVLASLRKVRPARDPVFRDGDLYGLDPHSEELDRIVFRLGLRPARVVAPKPPAVEAAPRPGPEQPLSVAELDEGWRDASLSSWSQQRLALAVLDAHGAPMRPEDVVAFVAARTKYFRMSVDNEYFRQSAAAVRIDAEGRWAMVPGRDELFAARGAVRDQIEKARRYARPDPAVFAASRREADRRREAHAAELSGLRRVIVHGFPVGAPVAVVMIDVGERQAGCFSGVEVRAVRERLAAYDVIAALDVRALLRGVGFEAGNRRLAELGPPQQSVTVNRRGGSLKIKPDMLVRGSCGVRRGLARRDQLERLTVRGQMAKLGALLEADARLLFGLYQYGRTHGAVRLRWGQVDEMLPVPWVHRDEHWLHDVKHKARDLGVEIDAVVGGAPDLDEPWSRAERFSVHAWPTEYDLALVDADGFVVDDRDVQIARLAATIH